MLNLRRSAIVLILAITLFFSLEKLSTGWPALLSLTNLPAGAVQEGTPALISIEPFVYWVGILAVVFVLAAPAAWQRNVGVPLFIWLMIYAVTKTWLAHFKLAAIIGGIQAYLTFTEMGMVAILVGSAYNLARHLHDFEEAVGNITFADLSRRIKKMDEATDDIQTELIRSRRHHHPLTVMVVEPEGDSIQVALNRTVQEVQRTMMTRYVTTSLARVISNQLRRTDLVIDQREKNRFIIISPDTTASNSAILVDRIQAAAAVQLGVLVACGVASFPDQALTFEELVQHAKTNLHSPADMPGLPPSGADSAGV